MERTTGSVPDHLGPNAEGDGAPTGSGSGHAGAVGTERQEACGQIPEPREAVSRRVGGVACGLTARWVVTTVALAISNLQGGNRRSHTDIQGVPSPLGRYWQASWSTARRRSRTVPWIGRAAHPRADFQLVSNAL